MLSGLLESNGFVNSIAREQSTHITATIFFEQYQKPGIPVVITGLLDAEPDWSLGYLCHALGSLEFPVRYYGRQRYEQNKREWTSIGSSVESKLTPFIQYAELLKNGKADEQDLYLGKCSIEHTSLIQQSTLHQVIHVLGLRKPVTSHNLWVGLAGHTTCLHYDPFDGILMQLHGSKRLILFPPSQLYNLYPFPLSTHFEHGLKLRSTYSQVYPEQPDFKAFPKLEQAFAHRYEVILNRGDILYIPASWWHEVTAIGDGVVCSVNRFWSVQPISRALLSWSKWRAYLGTIVATPYIVKDLFTALGSRDRKQKLRQLMQQL